MGVLEGFCPCFRVSAPPPWGFGGPPPPQGGGWGYPPGERRGGFFSPPFPGGPPFLGGGCFWHLRAAGPGGDQPVLVDAASELAGPGVRDHPRFATVRGRTRAEPCGPSAAHAYARNRLSARSSRAAGRCASFPSARIRGSCARALPAGNGHQPDVGRKNERRRTSCVARHSRRACDLYAMRIALLLRRAVPGHQIIFPTRSPAAGTRWFASGPSQARRTNRGRKSRRASRARRAPRGVRRGHLPLLDGHRPSASPQQRWRDTRRLVQRSANGRGRAHLEPRQRALVFRTATCPGTSPRRSSRVVSTPPPATRARRGVVRPPRRRWIGRRSQVKAPRSRRLARWSTVGSERPSVSTETAAVDVGAD